jgi:hypothetical protein
MQSIWGILEEAPAALEPVCLAYKTNTRCGELGECLKDFRRIVEKVE